jgi:hypothetical protein
MSFQKSEYGLMIFFSYLTLILSSTQVFFEKTKWTGGDLNPSESGDFTRISPFFFAAQSNNEKEEDKSGINQHSLPVLRQNNIKGCVSWKEVRFSQVPKVWKH